MSENPWLVGAKTVNGPLPWRVVARSPAVTAATRVDRSGVSLARTTMLAEAACGAVVVIGAALASLSSSPQPAAPPARAARHSTAAVMRFFIGTPSGKLTHRRTSPDGHSVGDPSAPAPCLHPHPMIRGSGWTYLRAEAQSANAFS